MFKKSVISWVNLPHKWKISTLCNKWNNRERHLTYSRRDQERFTLSGSYKMRRDNQRLVPEESKKVFTAEEEKQNKCNLVVTNGTLYRILPKHKKSKAWNKYLAIKRKINVLLRNLTWTHRWYRTTEEFWSGRSIQYRLITLIIILIMDLRETEWEVWRTIRRLLW